MKYLVKNDDQLMIMTVASSILTLPEGFEVIGLEGEFNPNSYDVSLCSLEEVEIAASYQQLVSPAIEAIEAVEGQEEVFDQETGEFISPAIEAVEGVLAQDAIYEIIASVRAMRVILKLNKAIEKKMVEIRVMRDVKMIENDTAWLIAAKKKQSLTALEAAAQVLRDLPEVAQTALEALSTVEEINAYDAFGV